MGWHSGVPLGVRTLVCRYLSKQEPCGVLGWENEIGESMASGLYFYTLKAGEFTATRKMLIVK